MEKKYLLFLLTSVLFLTFTSCTNTVLKSSALTEQVRRLAPENQKSISLQVNDYEANDSIGHQYLFLAIPFGNVQFSMLREAILNSTFTELAIAGFKPITANFAPPRYTRLQLDIKNIQVTAYDLLFVRKIVCHLDIDAKILDLDGNIRRAAETNSYASDYRAFAFERHLQHTFNTCLQNSISDLLIKLGLK